VATLVVIQGAIEGEIRHLAGRELTIGRHPSCDLVLNETTVSRRHARIAKRGDAFFIEDLGSQHGTYRNDHQVVTPEPLKHGDLIKVSEVTLEYRQDVLEVVEDTDPPEEDASSSIISQLNPLEPFDEEGLSDASLKLRRKMMALLRVTQLLGSSLNLSNLYQQILDCVFEIYPQTHRSFLLLSEAPNESLVCRAAKFRDETVKHSPVSRTIARQVMTQKTAILSIDTAEDERFKSADSVAGMEIRSVICAPLLAGDETPLGIIHVDTLNNREKFSAEDLEVLVSVANLIGRMIELTRLHEAQLTYERREQDIVTAKRMQMHFLPEESPDLPDYKVAHYYRAAEGVGGDYYDYIPLPDGRLAIAIGDISGKGVTAALLMARVFSEVRTVLFTTADLVKSLLKLNEAVQSFASENRFLTLSICVFEPDLHTVRIVNAGHMPPLKRDGHSGEVTDLAKDVAGVPLGVLDDPEFGEIVVKLAEGDSLLLYTDGLNEMINPERELFGMSRIREAYRQSAESESTIDLLLTELNAFAQGRELVDDLCMICITRNRTIIDQPTIAEIPI